MLCSSILRELVILLEMNFFFLGYSLTMTCALSFVVVTDPPVNWGSHTMTQRKLCGPRRRSHRRRLITVKNGFINFSRGRCFIIEWNSQQQQTRPGLLFGFIVFTISISDSVNCLLRCPLDLNIYKYLNQTELMSINI